MKGLWQQVQQLPDSCVRKVYGDHFPLEVRHCLSSWIEDNINGLNKINADDSSHERPATQLMAAMLSELDAKAHSLPSTDQLFLVKVKLMESASMFRSRYSSNALALVRLLQQSLLWEMQMINQFQMGGAEPLTELGLEGSCPAASGSSAAVQIYQQLQLLQQRVADASKQFEQLSHEHEAFFAQRHESNKLDTSLQHIQGQRAGCGGGVVTDSERDLQLKKDMLDSSLRQKMGVLLQMRVALCEQYKATVQLLAQLQARVLDDELIRWRRGQQLGGNGAPFTNNLDQIQQWCEELSVVIWETRHQIKEVERWCQRLPLGSLGATDNLSYLNQEITQLLSSLVTSSFVVERQPPQVMKTNTRFSASVRLLIGAKLSVCMSPPQVKVTIISECQANVLLKNGQLGGNETSGEIVSNTGTMEYQTATRQLAVHFRNMQLRKIRRAEKKGSESVMDEKFSLFFQSQFTIGAGELVFQMQVWTLSLPVVVTVHGNQEPHAWATVTWDNAFAEPGRLPFLVPDRVPWPRLATVISEKFRASTGRALSADNLQFLAYKLFRSGETKDYSTSVVTWAQFAKDPLSDRNFTFWEWLFAVMKLTKEHLRGPWNDGLVLGFLSRARTEELLLSRHHGTFLLRFSDSELGGVTIAWVAHEANEPHVYMLQPFTIKDFAIRSLSDRLYDLHHLSLLYPDLYKHQCFGKYYTPLKPAATTSSNGYVKPLLVTQIPGLCSPSSGQASPLAPSSTDSGTPAHYSARLSPQHPHHPHHQHHPHPHQHPQQQQQQILPHHPQQQQQQQQMFFPQSPRNVLSVADVNSPGVASDSHDGTLDSCMNL